MDVNVSVFRDEYLGSTQVHNNGEAWTIGRAPAGADMPPPPSIAWLGQIDPFALRAGEESTPLVTEP